MGKVAEDCPPVTTTLTGTEAAVGVSLESVTESPAAGAGPLRFTVPVEPAPAATVAGESEREVNAGGFTVRTAVFEVPPKVAVMVAEVVVPRRTVVTVKVAVLEPAATLTEAGTEADGSLLDSWITALES